MDFLTIKNTMQLVEYVLFLSVISSVHCESRNRENLYGRIITPDDSLQNKLHSNECTVISGTKEIVGLCVPIIKCDVLYKLLGEVERKPDLRTFLRSLRCSGHKGSSHVCCPYSSVETSRAIISDNFPIFLEPPNCGKTSKTESRILGGESSQIGAWPWIAALGYRTFDSPQTSWLCGGTIISQQHILTAAHCLKPKHEEYILHKVRIGGYDLTSDSDGLDVSIDTIITHPNYTFSKSSNDIGIVKLKRPIQFSSNIQPICLPKSERMRTENFVGQHSFVAGWGVTNYDTRGKSLTKLMQAQIPVVNNDFCNNSYAKHGRKINMEQICAYDENNQKDTCQGDSGGPLMFQMDNTNYIIGIVSFGYKCGEPGYPGVYARVSPYLNWISSVISSSK